MTHDVLAAALVRRADTVPGFRDVPRVVTLPPRMRLVLRERELLLLVASRRWLLGAPGTVLSRWPAAAVEIAVPSTCGPFMPVRIAAHGWSLTVAASWRQRAALKLIQARVRVAYSSTGS